MNTKASPRTRFPASLTVGLAAVGVALCANVAEAQPLITNINLPNSPNYYNVINTENNAGGVQFQGTGEANNNILTFKVINSVAVTNLTLQLSYSSFPLTQPDGVFTPPVTNITLTTGLPSTSNLWTVPLAADTVYRGTITASAPNGTSSKSVYFDTISPYYFTFELIDWDYTSTDTVPGGGVPAGVPGQFYDPPTLTNCLPCQTPIEPNTLDGLPSTSGIDMLHNTEIYPAYNSPGNIRPISLPDPDQAPPSKIPGAQDIAKEQYLYWNKVGYNNGAMKPGDWLNYTRRYPAGVYNIYLRASCGTPDGAWPVHGLEAALVTSGRGTTNQTTQIIGWFGAAALGYPNYRWSPCLDGGLPADINGSTPEDNGNGLVVAWATPGDVETLRFLNGTIDVASGSRTGIAEVNWWNLWSYMVVPAAPFINARSPNADVYEGSSVTLSLNAKAVHEPYLQWMTDNGSGGATWAAVPGVPSTNMFVLNTTGFTPGTYQFKVALTNAGVTNLVTTNMALNVTSAGATLKVRAASAPVVVQNPTPASTTANVGSIISLTASFEGTTPITNQWEVSTNGGVTWSLLPGQTNTTLLVTNFVAMSNVQYHLVASNAVGYAASAPAILNVVLVQPQPLQLAGDLIVALQSVDLSSGATVWSNRATSSASVGDFQNTGGTVLNVRSDTTPPWKYQQVNALFVNNNTDQAVQSALPAPDEILMNMPFSAEAWVYAIGLGNGFDASTVMCYGDGGPSAPWNASNRMLNYSADLVGVGGTAFLGSGGTLNGSWTTAPEPGAWRYLAWTYNGSNFIAYLDGAANASQLIDSPGLNTTPTVVAVGASLIGFTGVIAGPNAFSGYIASVRLSSGVLTPSQVSSNYVVGPLAVVPVVTVPSLEYSFSGGSLTFTWSAGRSLMEATNVLGPWTTLTNQSPYVLIPASSGPVMFFKVNP